MNQGPSVPKVACVEPFCNPAIDWGEKIAGFMPLALFASKMGASTLNLRCKNVEPPMSPMGYSRKSADVRGMSPFPSKAEIEISSQGRC
jgi:hypothetical protein